MRIKSSDIYSLFRPEFCERRLYLKAQGIQESEPNPFTQLLFDLGNDYEAKHLQTLGKYIDLSEGSFEERFQNTLSQTSQNINVLYQPVLKTTISLKSDNIEIIGVPDFFIRHEKNYIIRDCKISRNADEKRHPEILYQLQLFGWLYEKCFDKKPEKLEVYLGTGELIEVFYEGEDVVLDLLHKIDEFSIEEHYSPVGWSKCSSCVFRDHCWHFAVEVNDVATLPNVDKGLATALREQGIFTYDQLVEKFSESELAEFKRPWGKQLRRVGAAAKAILGSIEAITNNTVIKKDDFTLPESDNYVMFDLEGMPPQLDEVEKVYLWGMQVFGNKPSDYIYFVSKLGPDGDRQSWNDFLTQAKNIFDIYGELPFIHWASYEKSKVRLYIERYGDRDGIAGNVLENLFDLYTATQKAFYLPSHSYSLKELEGLVGYERSMEDYGGQWAMAQYIIAVESNNEEKYSEFINDILLYNKEDLEATWKVMSWLKDQ